MSILVVDPDKNSLDVAAEMLHWVDRRYRVELAADGSSASALAMKMRPNLILCEPVLPDMSGSDLCMQLQNSIPKSMYAAYSSLPIAYKGFDETITKPLARLELLALVQKLSIRRREKFNSRKIGVELDALTSSLRVGDKRTALVPLVVYLSEEPDVKFSVQVPEGASIKMVLKQLGKSNITWFSLIRHSRAIDATLDAPVAEGDVLTIRL